MAKTKSLVVVMLIVAVWECILLWLVLHPGSATKVGNDALFPFLLLPFFVCRLFPVPDCPKMAAFQLGMVLLVLSVFLTVVFAFLHYCFQVDNLWVQRMFDLSQILFVVGNLLLVWQATRKHT